MTNELWIIYLITKRQKKLPLKNFLGVVNYVHYLPSVQNKRLVVKALEMFSQTKESILKAKTNTDNM